MVERELDSFNVYVWEVGDRTQGFRRCTRENERANGGSAGDKGRKIGILIYGH